MGLENGRWVVVMRVFVKEAGLEPTFEEWRFH